MSDSAELFKKLANRRTTESQKDGFTDSRLVKTKKRGRPAVGKRSDPNWIGRTFYVRKETDLDIEAELLQLKRQGIEIDKSELVDILLGAWVKWRQGENIDSYLDEISPRQNSSK